MTVLSLKRPGLCFLLLAVVLSVVAVPSLNPRAQAQQEEGKEPAKEPAKEPEKKEEAKGEDTHFLLRITSRLLTGLESVLVVVIFAMLGIMSVALVTIIYLLILDLRLPIVVPPAFVEEFISLVNQRKFKGAYDLTKNDSSFLAQVLSAGMSRLQYGIDDAREASLNQVESVRAAKDNLIHYLGTIGTLGPMIGLVGTVVGMIGAFEIIGSTATPSANALAGKIATALVLTFLGILISVPAIFAFSFFKNRLTRMAMEASNLADDLLTQMYHNSKKAPAADTGASAIQAPATVPAARPAAVPAVKKEPKPG